MTTEKIITDLRNYTMSSMREAADRLEELERDLVRLRRVTTRPEPSRLEIAAMLLAAMCGSQYTWTNAEPLALRKADVLIALSKEAK